MNKPEVKIDEKTGLPYIDTTKTIMIEGVPMTRQVKIYSEQGKRPKIYTK